MVQQLAPRQIIGVDYSGSQDDVPWITQATLEGNVLSLYECAPISRENLTQHLLDLPNHAGNPPAMVGMDFPFGVANVVFPDLQVGRDILLQMWGRVAGMQRWEFEHRRNGHNGAMRMFDQLHYRMAQSPTNIRMWRMTYHGIKMLWELHNRCPNRWHIPPLHHGRDHDGRVTLL